MYAIGQPGGAGGCFWLKLTGLLSIPTKTARGFRAKLIHAMISLIERQFVAETCACKTAPEIENML
jgi:hypothetical protein